MDLEDRAEDVNIAAYELDLRQGHLDFIRGHSAAYYEGRLLMYGPDKRSLVLRVRDFASRQKSTSPRFIVDVGVAKRVIPLSPLQEEAMKDYLK